MKNGKVEFYRRVLPMVCLFNAVQLCSSVQPNLMQCNSVQYNAIVYSSVQLILVQCNSVQYNAIQLRALRRSIIPDSAPCSSVKHGLDYPSYYLDTNGLIMLNRGSELS